MEAVHSTAYDGGLGNALLASQESIDAIDGDALREFIAENYVAPRMVLAASGRITKSWCPSSPMLETVSKGSATTTSKEIPSKYMGGDFRVKNESPLTSLIWVLNSKEDGEASGPRRLFIHAAWRWWILLCGWSGKRNVL